MSTSTNVFAQNSYIHNIGLSGGHGDPHEITGIRLSYRYLHYKYKNLSFLADYSYAYWHTNGYAEHVHVLAIAPVIRIKLLTNHNLNIHCEVSIGPAYRTNPLIGDQPTGSHWTFQDLLGIGVTYKERLEFRMHYMHYSNAGLARPNPGTDIRPLFTIGYNFA